MKIKTNVEVLTNVTNFKGYKTLPSLNREVNEAHVKELCDSFREFGTSSAVVRVLETNKINGKLERYTVDGQHTMIAAQRCGLGVIVIITRLENDSKFKISQYIAVLNNSSKGWSTGNYLHTFSNNDVYEYKKFNKIIETDGLRITDLQCLYLVRPKEYKSGKMKFADEKDSDLLLDALRKVIHVIPNKSFTRRSFYKVMRIAKDYDRMANAILSCAKGLKTAHMNFSENEREFYDHLIKVYQAEFKK